MRKITIIAARSQNGVIGQKGTLPWRIRSDMKFFRDTTMGHAVIMGRSTYDSIDPRYKPLEGRVNIVLSRTWETPPEGVILARSLEEAVAQVPGGMKCFIAGGQTVYNEALHIAGEMLLTEILAKVEGDAIFPNFSTQEWELTERSQVVKNSQDQFPLCFCRYKRFGAP